MTASGLERLSSVEDALALLLAGLGPTSAPERVALDAAPGRVLAADVVAARALPGCDNSAMDGFAVRAAECATRVTLPVHGESRAGHAPPALAPGSAMAISTGAPVPNGADAVVRVEDTEVGPREVTILVAPSPGLNVRAAGGDVRPGTVMVPAGRRLRAVDIAACAAVGAARVAVHVRPRVAIIAGGDELVGVGVTPSPAQVVDSNSPMIAAAVREAGGEPVLLGVMTDDREAVRETLAQAAGCDLVVSTAGVSVGAHDHVRSVVEELGRVLAWRVAMRPGKPVLVGDIGGTRVLGLPGNPVSGAVTFELFARPAVLALQGATAVRRRPIAVRMAEAVATPHDLATYLRVHLGSGDDAIPLARLSGGQGSSMLHSLTGADALALVPAGTGDVAAGTVLTALELS